MSRRFIIGRLPVASKVSLAIAGTVPSHPGPPAVPEWASKMSCKHRKAADQWLIDKICRAAMSGTGEQFLPVCSALSDSDAGRAEGAEAMAALGMAAEGRQGRWHIDTTA
jgi:hypothetical protein